MTLYIQVSPQGNKLRHWSTSTPHFLVEFGMAVRTISSLLKRVRTFVPYSTYTPDGLKTTGLDIWEKFHFFRLSFKTATDTGWNTFWSWLRFIFSLRIELHYEGSSPTSHGKSYCIAILVYVTRKQDDWNMGDETLIILVLLSLQQWNMISHGRWETKLQRITLF